MLVPIDNFISRATERFITGVRVRVRVRVS